MVTGQFDPVTRGLAALLAALYAVLGFWLFIWPETSSTQFAWKVSPFVTQTIGAWCLGTAWLAAVCAWRAHWPLAQSPMLYLALFGLFEGMVLYAFRERVVLAHPQSWLYVTALGVNAVLAVVAALRLPHQWATRRVDGLAATRVTRAFTLLFIAFVGGLAAYALLGARPATGGRVFPEPMTLFTVRSFGAFYLALALAAIPLLFIRGIAPLLFHGFASYGLIVIITVAALRHLHLFDFVNRPLGLLYFGAYVGVGTVVLFYLLKFGIGGVGRAQDERIT